MADTPRGRKKNITGKWFSVSGDDSSIEIEFNPDNTLTSTVSYKVTSSIFYGKISIDAKHTGRWEITKDSLILFFDTDKFSLVANDSAITYKPEMKDSVNTLIKDLTGPQMFERMKNEVFSGERIGSTTNLDPTGKKLEITTDNGIAIHLTR